MKKMKGLLLIFSSLALLVFSSFFVLHFTFATEQRKGCKISCEVSKQIITYGESVGISGRLSDPLTGEGLQRMINITYSEDNGTTWKQLKEISNELGEYGNDIWTNQTGYYGPYTWKPGYIPHNLLIGASYGGDEAYAPVESITQSLTVDLPPDIPVEILNHRSYLWSNSTLWIVGEVHNIGTTNLEQVNMAVVYYDSVGAIIGTDKCSIQLGVISPGQMAPFITFAGVSYSYPINASFIAGYEIAVRSYSSTTVELYKDLIIVNEEAFFDELDNYHVYGAIVNNGTIPVESVAAVGSFYDTYDNLIDAWFSLPYPSDLSPNQNTTFNIELDKSRLDAVGEIDHYFLQVDYHVERTSSTILCSISSMPGSDNITVSGSVTPVPGEVLVAMNFTKPDNTTSIIMITTTPEGDFNYTFKPEDSGVWSVRASWPGILDIEGATSTSTSITIEETTIRKTPPPIAAAVATSVGVAVPAGVTALAGWGGLGQYFNVIISKLSSWVKTFLQSYMKQILPVQPKPGEKAPFLARIEMVELGFSTLVLTLVYGFVGANGLPHFLNPSVLLVIIPVTLLTSGISMVAAELRQVLILKIYNIRGDLKIWLQGLIAFLISGLVFKIPFSTPVRYRYKGSKISAKTGALINILKMLMLLPLLILYSIAIMLGFRRIGDIGLLSCLTSVFYQLMPIKPLDGKAIFDYDRKVWLLAFVPMMILFYTWVLNLLPWTVYLAAGIISTVAGVILAIQQYKTTIVLEPRPSLIEVN